MNDHKVKIYNREFEVLSIKSPEGSGTLYLQFPFSSEETDFCLLPNYKKIIKTQEIELKGKNNIFVINRILEAYYKEIGVVIKVRSANKGQFSHIFNFRKNQFERIIGSVTMEQLSDFITAIEKTIEHENNERLY